MSVYATEEFVEFSRKRAELNAVIKAEGEDFKKAMDAFKARRKELEEQGAAMDGGWEKFAAQYIEKEKEQNSRIQEMIEKVNAWPVPSPDHQGLKDFMQ